MVRKEGKKRKAKGIKGEGEGQYGQVRRKKISEREESECGGRL